MYNENMISRNIAADLTQSKKSVLLLGPRQVGKSTLITSFKPDLSISLMDQQEFFRFTSNPGELRDQIETQNAKIVFIDEIQRHPALLNTVQALVDERKGLKFYITGSSARKLRRGQANLLPGRVFNYLLGPLVSSELNYKGSQDSLLKFGSLPEVYLEKDDRVKKQLLASYFVNYLQEEIRAESLVRNIESFSRALPSAMQTSGQFIDYSKLAAKVKVSRHALSRFFEIFEDTLVGQRIWPDPKLLERADLIKHPKFFVFDVGIYNAVAGSFDLSSERKGVLFEHLIHNQLLHSAWSKNKPIQIASFRTRGGLEVDFIVTLEGQRFAIEAKASTEIVRDELLALHRVKNEYEPKIDTQVACLGTKSKKIDGIWCHPWQVLLKELGL